METKRTMTHASLFSGIGGAELAASWMGWSNLFHCELNQFCRKVLEYWFPNSTSYGDITTTDFTPWRGKIGILTGGFPCQPFSLAGSRRGAEDDRYLWPHMLRAVREIQPAWVVGENVAGILTMVQPGEAVDVAGQASLFGESDLCRTEQQYVIETICQDLEGAGYSVQPFDIPACAVGAPHRRERVWIIAHRADAGAETMQCGRENGVHAAGFAAYTDEHRRTPCRLCEGAERSGRGDIPQQEEWGNPSQRSDRLPGLSRDATYTQRIRRYESELYDGKSEKTQQEECGEQQFVGTDCPQSKWRNFPTQPPVCNGDDGLSLGLAGITFPKWRAEAVKALGNAWVPQVAYEIFRAIEAANAEFEI